jgi:hypothetical protein
MPTLGSNACCLASVAESVKGCTSGRSQVRRMHVEGQCDQQSHPEARGESRRRRSPYSERQIHFRVARCSPTILKVDFPKADCWSARAPEFLVASEGWEKRIRHVGVIVQFDTKPFMCEMFDGSKPLPDICSAKKPGSDNQQKRCGAFCSRARIWMYLFVMDLLPNLI